MIYEIIKGIFLPFLGTTLGASSVYIMKNRMSDNTERGLTGFAAGVMTAASVWSLLLPAMEQSGFSAPLSFVPATVGFWIGVLFLLSLDHLIPHPDHVPDEVEGIGVNKFDKTVMLVFAVVLHNIPEGIAVGIVYASLLSGRSGVTAVGAFALSLGIAIQNFPEGAIVSMPLRSSGMSRWRSWLYGMLSGVVEPISAVLTLMLTSLVEPLFPYLLGFAAGAMMFVVTEELVPEASGNGCDTGSVMFALGFTLMMSLDVALG